MANRICGYTPSMAKVLEPGQETLMTFLPARVVHNDLLAKKYLERVEQAVLMGAGFDLRLLELSRVEMLLDRREPEQDFLFDLFGNLHLLADRVKSLCRSPENRPEEMLDSIVGSTTHG